MIFMFSLKINNAISKQSTDDDDDLPGTRTTSSTPTLQLDGGPGGLRHLKWYLPVGGRQRRPLVPAPPAGGRQRNGFSKQTSLFDC